VWEGFSVVEVPPSPNDHAHDVGEFVEESTNWTPRGWLPLVTLETNPVTGIAATLLTTIYPVWVSVLLPSAFVAVRVTV